jgi:hypothetical protein
LSERAKERLRNGNCAVYGVTADSNEEAVVDRVGRVAHRACIDAMRTLVGGFP